MKLADFHFNAIDTSGCGKIKPEELVEYLLAKGVAPTNLHELVMSIDLDGDGDITLEEWVRGVGSHPGLLPDEPAVDGQDETYLEPLSDDTEDEDTAALREQMIAQLNQFREFQNKLREQEEQALAQLGTRNAAAVAKQVLQIYEARRGLYEKELFLAEQAVVLGIDIDHAALVPTVAPRGAGKLGRIFRIFRRVDAAEKKRTRASASQSTAAVARAREEREKACAPVRAWPAERACPAGFSPRTAARG